MYVSTCDVKRCLDNAALFLLTDCHTKRFELFMLAHGPAPDGHALDERWSFDVHQTVDALVIDHEDCFIVGRSTRLFALNGRTGAPRWSARVKNSWGWLAVNPSTVFYLNQHSQLVAHDRTTGELQWTRELREFQGWLHAFENHVIVGGWRGYTNILALRASDGMLQWSWPARSIRLHHTRVHTASRTLVVANSDGNGRILFLDLQDGKPVQSVDVPGEWTTATCERIRGSSIPEEPMVLDCDANSITLLEGVIPTVTRRTLPEPPWSTQLRNVHGFVPYLSRTNELIALELATSRILRLGRVDHNRNDFLPFIPLGNDRFAYGTSFGMLGVVAPGEKPVAERVCKRVATVLESCGTSIIFGTASGNVVAYRVGLS